MKKFMLIAMLSCISARVGAQVDVGAGAELGFPLLFNSFVKGHNHASGVPGARLVVNYTPGEGQFTGSLVAGIAPMILPVVRFNAGQDVLYMNFTSTNLSLLGRIYSTFM